MLDSVETGPDTWLKKHNEDGIVGLSGAESNWRALWDGAAWISRLRLLGNAFVLVDRFPKAGAS